MRPRFRKQHLFYAAAAAAFAFAATSVVRTQPKAERLDPVGAINEAPFKEAIAATGMVEPLSRVITVAPDIEGAVSAVFVAPGDRVTAGAPLFALDDRRQRARLAEAKARLAKAEAGIALGKAEEGAAIASAEAARITATRLRASVERYRPIAREAMSAEDFDKLSADADEALYAARAAEETALSAGAAAEAAVEEAALARAELAGAEAELARAVLRSPIDGAVLGLDVRVGEAVRPTDRTPASVSVGDIGTLVARVEIDEAEAARFDPAAGAAAYLRGRPGEPIALRFLSVERMLKPKAAFRDASAEYVDARILEARYVIKSADPLYVGQLLDVYIDAAGAADGKTAASSVGG